MNEDTKEEQPAVIPIGPTEIFLEVRVRYQVINRELGELLAEQLHKVFHEMQELAGKDKFISDVMVYELQEVLVTDGQKKVDS